MAAVRKPLVAEQLPPALKLRWNAPRPPTTLEAVSINKHSLHSSQVALKAEQVN
jgi:hypothetical protein